MIGVVGRTFLYVGGYNKDASCPALNTSLICSTECKSDYLEMRMKNIMIYIYNCNGALHSGMSSEHENLTNSRLTCNARVSLRAQYLSQTQKAAPDVKTTLAVLHRSNTNKQSKHKHAIRGLFTCIGGKETVKK